jgi:hypothetical protein
MRIGGLITLEKVKIIDYRSDAKNAIGAAKSRN